jgi:hypothetical protein
MAQGDRPSSSAIIQRVIPSWDAKLPQAMDEGPAGIAKRQSRLETVQLELRALFPSIAKNTMFNPATGGEEAKAKFLFKLVGSFCSAKTVLFGDSEVTILSGEQSIYIEPPSMITREGRLRPLYVSNFVYGEISPQTMAQDSRVAPEIHEDYAIEFAEEGKRSKYLFPAESNIINTLHRISSVPAPSVIETSPGEASPLDRSALAVYLPKNIDEARAILLKGTPFSESHLDLIKIHDTLETSTQVLFSGDEKKTSVPFSILQVSGGIKYYLYPYGISLPMGPIPQGCTLLVFQRTEDQKVYYLLLPEVRVPAIIARGLPPQGQETRIGEE